MLTIVEDHQTITLQVIWRCCLLSVQKTYYYVLLCTIIIPHFASILVVTLHLHPSCSTVHVGVEPCLHMQCGDRPWHKHGTSGNFMWRHYQSAGGMSYSANSLVLQMFNDFVKDETCSSLKKKLIWLYIHISKSF